MKENNWIKIANPLIKQGNSFCVRIPSSVIKQMKAKRGDYMVMKVKKVDLELTEGVLEAYYKETRKCKKTSNFSREKVYFLGSIVFLEGKKIIDTNRNKLTDTMPLSEQKKLLKVQNDYRNKIKKELGEKLYKDYILLRECLERKVK